MQAYYYVKVKKEIIVCKHTKLFLCENAVNLVYLIRNGTSKANIK
jgi:hypothetical protein